MKRAVGLLVVALVALVAPPARAAVKPHSLFTDGAVLQQGIRVPVWGTAADGEKVTVRIQDQSASTTAKEGQWIVRLRPMKAGGPYTLTIAGENTVELRDVLVGEVYVCSGQSNMEWPLTRTTNAQEAIAQSHDPMLHLFTVAHAISDTPLREVKGDWKTCAPDTVPGFSAVAYYFGRDLRRALNVPVGLINTSWGGTPAEAWTSRGTLETTSGLQSILSNYAQAKERYAAARKAYEDALARHQEAVAQAERDGAERPKPPAPPYNPENQNRPSGLYNAMIAPLQPYAIRGGIWYQGESNAGRAYEYQTLFPAMIQDWRQHWSQGEFPFFFVQLAPFLKIETEPKESAWAELREAQRLTTLTLPRTGMAVITDAGEENDIHPQRKEPVGSRLALAARAITYGERIEYSGPTYHSMRVQGDRAILRFKHVGRGLMAKDGELKGFTIAGEDKKWVNAKAEIQGDRIIVSSPQVPHPVAVRYGWANYPVVNLYNQDGLPATPFRTDAWPLTTQPR